MGISTWSQAVRDVLRAADIHQAQLATSLGMHLPTIHRYVQGDRTPNDVHAVDRINAAVGKLSGHSGVEPYLRFEAVDSGLLHDSDRDAPAREAQNYLRRYACFLTPLATEYIGERMRAPEGEKLVHALRRAFGHVIVAELSAKKLSAKASGFHVVIDALEAHGINAGNLLRDGAQAQLVFERFAQTVNAELARANSRMPARERLQALRRILDALPLPNADGTLRELATLEDGSYVSHFYGDARVWMQPFMAPTKRVVVRVPIERADTPSPRVKRGKKT